MIQNTPFYKNYQSELNELKFDFDLLKKFKTISEEKILETIFQKLIKIDEKAIRLFCIKFGSKKFNLNLEGIDWQNFGQNRLKIDQVRYFDYFFDEMKQLMQNLTEIDEFASKIGNQCDFDIFKKQNEFRKIKLKKLLKTPCSNQSKNLNFKSILFNILNLILKIAIFDKNPSKINNFLPKNDENFKISFKIDEIIENLAFLINFSNSAVKTLIEEIIFNNEFQKDFSIIFSDFIQSGNFYAFECIFNFFERKKFIFSDFLTNEKSENLKNQLELIILKENCQKKIDLICDFLIKFSENQSNFLDLKICLLRLKQLVPRPKNLPPLKISQNFNFLKLKAKLNRFCSKKTPTLAILKFYFNLISAIFLLRPEFVFLDAFLNEIQSILRNRSDALGVFFGNFYSLNCFENLIHPTLFIENPKFSDFLKIIDESSLLSSNISFDKSFNISSDVSFKENVNENFDINSKCELESFKNKKRKIDSTQIKSSNNSLIDSLKILSLPKIVKIAVEQKLKLLKNYKIKTPSKKLNNSSFKSSQNSERALDHSLKDSNKDNGENSNKISDKNFNKNSDISSEQALEQAFDSAENNLFELSENSNEDFDWNPDRAINAKGGIMMTIIGKNIYDKFFLLLHIFKSVKIFSLKLELKLSQRFLKVIQCKKTLFTEDLKILRLLKKRIEKKYLKNSINMLNDIRYSKEINRNIKSDPKFNINGNSLIENDQNLIENDQNLIKNDQNLTKNDQNLQNLEKNGKNTPIFTLILTSENWPKSIDFLPHKTKGRDLQKIDNSIIQSLRKYERIYDIVETNRFIVWCHEHSLATIQLELANEKISVKAPFFAVSVLLSIFNFSSNSPLKKSKKFKNEEKIEKMPQKRQKMKIWNFFELCMFLKVEKKKLKKILVFWKNLGILKAVKKSIIYETPNNKTEKVRKNEKEEKIENVNLNNFCLINSFEEEKIALKKIKDFLIK